MDIQDKGFSDLGLTKHTVGSPSLCCYARNLDQASANNPILVLIQGYPQTSYMWRLTVPLLPPSAPLFIPDLPGYGQSEPLQKHDKLTVGLAILSGLKTLTKSSSTTPIVLIGHDRGGRVSHRLAVSKSDVSNLGFDLLATSVIDIVPTKVQWAAFADPRSSVIYWHWPFLAKPFAPEIINTIGGSKYIFQQGLRSIAGQGSKSATNLASGDAMKVYGAAFDNPSVVQASCADYEAASNVDIEMQDADQAAGKKIEVPFMVLHGSQYIAKTFDVKKVWGEWIMDEKSLSVHCAAEGIGHFVPEEAPEETVQVIGDWLKALKIW
ncbi:alpha/beta-hydrolase [Rhizodiscina lignyota]|uniref:Alpha/beta-hydrolase n=1 Tax=Rhizodiscina lignyota TaxID=1504668 RepID=A0A9P4I656_9PEZI|nr:alpha/beta-hydrolase [Rhizodiscina lignyota]